MTRLHSNERDSEPVSVAVHYTLRIPAHIAEALVGRAWTHDGPDDDSWACALEEAVQDGLPDLLRYASDDPYVEWW